MDILVKIKSREVPHRVPRQDAELTKRGKPKWEALENAGVPVEVLGVPFGGHIEGRDEDGQAFHKGTDIVLNPGDEVPLTYYHGFGPDDPFEMQNPPEIIGVAKYREETDGGHVFDALIDPTTPLGLRLSEALLEKRDLKASSGAIAHLVRLGNAGLIDYWPVAELAVFDTNEWRQPANQLATVRAKRKEDSQAGGLFDSTRKPQTLETVNETVTEGAGTGTFKSHANQEMEEQTMENKENKENKIELSQDQLDAIVKRAAETAVDKYLKKAPADNPEEQKDKMITLTQADLDGFAKRAAESAVDEYLKKAPADNPEGGVKATAPAVIRDRGEADPVKAFYHYVRTGQVMRGAKAALQEGTPSEGGYLVPDDEYRQIIAKRDEMSIVRQLGAMSLTTNRDRLNIPVEDGSLTKFSIVPEEGAISDAEDEPTFGQVPVTIYNFKKLIKVSEELLEDDNANLEQFLIGALARAAADTENYYALVGTGSGQPQGVFVGGTAALTFDANNAIGVGEIPELKYKLAQPYRDDGAAWVMNPTTEAYLRGLNSPNHFVFAPTPAATGVRGMETLEGFPVFTNSNVAAIGGSAKSLLFGNFRYYVVVTNKELRIRRLTELYAGNGQVGILASMRFGGAVLQAEAFQYATHPA